MKTYLLLVTLIFIAGCDPRPEKYLSNTQIIADKKECETADMGYYVLHYNGNPAFPYKVVCENRKDNK